MYGSQASGEAQLRWFRRGLGLAAILLLTLLAAIWIQNRPRVLAFSHLRRDQRKQALLDTWTMPPARVLQSFPESESVIGIYRRGPRALQEFLGTDIVNARLVGLYVDDSDMEALQRFPEIEYLELFNTSVTDAAIERFQQARPACKVVRRLEPVAVDALPTWREKTP
jgi:hypothetical protein